MEEDRWKAFPISCECLAECHALNYRLVYVDKCINSSLQKLHVKATYKPTQGTPLAIYPWLDPFEGGSWMRQAYTPGRRDPSISEDELARLNVALAKRLNEDGAASVAAGFCSGRGLYTTPMPWHDRRYANEKHCHCAPGFYGDECECGPGSACSPQAKRHCVHDCSARGVCKLNWCHCVPGTWGIDCSFGDPDAQLTRAVTRYQAALQLQAPTTPNGLVGWPTSMLSVPKPALPAPSRKLRIFVHELPPKFNVWLAAHFRREGRWDQSYLYSLDAKIHRWLLRSPYRTLNPAEADYFLVPLYLSLGYYDYGFGLYWLERRAQVFMREALEYVAHASPWYNSSQGADHLLVMTNDKGGTFIRGSIRALEKMILITQWCARTVHLPNPLGRCGALSTDLHRNIQATR